MAASFHPRAGRLVSLSNGGRTARRLRAAHEFNHGLVMSREPLQDGQLFQIRIDRKLNSWSGSLEVGLTSRDPGEDASELPSSATTLRGGAWLLSGSCVLHDAKTLLDAYGRTHAGEDECVDLDSLEEGALVGVQRTAAGEFHVWVNGHDRGVAATGLPSPVWALIDLYGKCTQVTVVDDEAPQQAADDQTPEASSSLSSAALLLDNIFTSRAESCQRGSATRHGARVASPFSMLVDTTVVAVDAHSSTLIGGAALAVSSSTSLLTAPAHSCSWPAPPPPHAPVSACNDALLFHAKCGALIRLSNNQKTAERRRPLDEFNNGVVLTNRPLRHGETFEIRIDRLVDKWSGSLEIGVTTHDPNSMDYPATMTNMMSGTIMMSGCGILTNGKGTRREYCDFSLDELQEGDHIGLIRKSNGELHFYVNGLDQGIAASQTATTVYGVVDLYGMAAKVTIVHEQNHADRLRRNTAIMRAVSPESANRRARVTAGSASHSGGGASASRLDLQPEADACSAARIVTVPTPVLLGENFDEIFDLGGNLETLRGGERSTQAVRAREREMDEVGWRDEEQETERETAEVAEGEKSAEDDKNSSRERRRGQVFEGNASGLSERYEDTQSRRYRNGEARRQSLGDQERETNRDNYLSCSDLDYAVSPPSYTDFGIAYCRTHATQENLLRSARSRESQVEREVNREEEMDTDRQVEREGDRGRLLPELNLSTNHSDFRHLIAHTNVRLAASWRERRANGHEDLESERQSDGIGLGLSQSNIYTNARLSRWRERDTERERDRGRVLSRSMCTTEPNQLLRPAETIFANNDFSGLDNGSDVEHNGQSSDAMTLAAHPSADSCGPGEMETSVMTMEGAEGAPVECGPLLFHPNCGQRAAVVNGGRTALRPNALEDFNHGVVLSNRPLGPGERFEVRIDRMVDKWAGSIEVGVTTHSPVRIALPSTMTNMRSGTWMMTGNGVMHNGTTILDDYGHNLDHLRAGDSVGVIRHADGSLNLLVNGEDQGRAAVGVPPCVYAVLDLYGQAAQATILDSAHDMPPLPDDLSDTHTHPTPCTPPLSLCDCGNGPTRCDLVFAHFHGSNAIITNGGRTAFRQNPRAEFNEAIVITNRPLRDGELFEIVIEKMVDRWSGSIEVGVTSIPPEELHFPNTMTDIDHDTWMLSYGSDLDRLGFGSRIGMLRSRHGALHYFINGVDQGPAATGLPTEVYAVVDLYGQCAQVSVTASSGVVDNSLSSSVVTHLSLPEDSPRLLGVAHRLHNCCGKGIVLRREGRSALRLHGYAHGLLFSAAELRTGELFEVQVDDVNDLWAGTLHAGLTSLSTSDPARLAHSALQLRSKLTWLVVGSEVRCNGVTQRQNYGTALDRLRVGNRIGVKRCHDDTMHLVIDGKDMGPAATGVPAGVHAVFDLYGTVTSVSVTSTGCALVCASPEKITAASALQATSSDPMCSAGESPVFVDGKNLLLSNQGRTATRRDGCSQAVARTAHVLPRQHLLQVCIDRLSHEWSGSLCLGLESVREGQTPPPHVLQARSPAMPLTASAPGSRQQSWLIRGRAVYHNSTKIRDGYGPDLDSLAEGTRVGLLVDALGALHLYVNGIDQGACATHIPVNIRLAVHLYGCCMQVTLVTDDGVCGDESCEDREKADMVDGLKEGLLRPPTGVDGSVLRAVCDYQAVCVRFRDLLALPGGFFTPCVSCFCASCCHLREDEAYRTRGEPPRDYSLPLGWVHFTLRTNPRSDATFLKRWHVAYHGANIGDVRRSLDHGELCAASRCPLFAQKVKVDESGAISVVEGPATGPGDATPGLITAAVRLSPSLRHASRDCCYITFRDPKTQSVHVAQVALQVCVRPGAYKYSAHAAASTGRVTHPVESARVAHTMMNTYPHALPTAAHSNVRPPDTRFPSSEIEWFTKERGSTIITALLVRVE